MLRLPLLVILLTQVTHPIRTAYVTNSPSFADRLDRIFEKFDRLTVAPQVVTHAPEKWESKLEKFRSLSPESVFLSDDEEELLSAMQSWGGLSADQLRGVAQDLQRMRAETDDDAGDLSDTEYADLDDNDEDYTDYRNDADGKYDEDDEEPETSSPPPRIPPGVTPSAYTRHGPYRASMQINPITATNERPVILEDPSDDKRALREAALLKAGEVLRASKCLTPQSRWLTVSQLAPAADTAYIPPCVSLHRCAPDAGCCTNDSQVCAPIDGNYVTLPFLLHRADVTQRAMLHPVRMVFYNHTRCGCVSHTSYQRAMELRHVHNVVRTDSEERQKDWLPPVTQPPTAHPSTVQPRTVQPRAVQQVTEEDITAPPQMRRCTCPTLFLANMSDSGNCSCGCDWRESTRRRECLLFTRGREHLALRDRVCIANGDCAPPACDYGAYDTTAGRCPVRKFRRVRYHVRPRQHDKNVV